MAGDERQEEREFLAELKARSGQDLAQWMGAIAAQGLADRNQIIDWLRARGFPFARASWLERIHSNGGKPIYVDEPPAPAAEPLSPKLLAKPAPPPKPPGAREAAALEKLLAAAKGYRPLYHLLEAEIRRAVPGVEVKPKANYIAFAGPDEFAAVTAHAGELRLGLALGDRPHEAPLQRPKMKGSGPTISHMLVLTDARQVNAELMGLILAANARVNG
jgi:hypothetical protein